MRVLKIEDVKEALELRRGGAARVWEYRVSHSWLIFRIIAKNLAGNFHLLCGDCERIECDNQWMPINIEIEEDGEMFIVRDGSHLFIKCDIVTGEYNVPPLF